MTDVKSKRFAGGETFETADRLHSAAIHLLRRLRVRDRESGVGRRSFRRCRCWCWEAAHVRSASLRSGTSSSANHEPHRCGPGACRPGAPRKTEDGRRVRLEATAKGTKILQEGRRRRVDSLAQALASLSSEDREKLRELIDHLEKVIRRL